MDVAQQLALDSGPAAVTIRALSELTSMSNGALYHAFGSRAGLLGRAWLRDAQRMLAAQGDAVQTALDGGTPEAAVAAVVAAADAPAKFLLESPRAGKFLLTVPRSDLLGDADIPAEIADELTNLDKTLLDLFLRLSEAVWGRADRHTVSVIRDCVVELPTALLLRGRRTPDDIARARLAAAVRGVLSIDPP